MNPGPSESFKSARPVVVITGGEGDLATTVASEFARADYEVVSPGRRELDVLSEASVEKLNGLCGWPTALWS